MADSAAPVTSDKKMGHVQILALHQPQQPPVLTLPGGTAKLQETLVMDSGSPKPQAIWIHGIWMEYGYPWQTNCSYLHRI